MRTSLTVGLLAALTSVTVFAQQTDSSPCVVVFSQGQNMSGSDTKVNQMWNHLNDSFGQFVSNELKDAGKRVVVMPHPVEVTNVVTNTDRLLKRSQEEGCDAIVSASMYADQNTRQFMSTLRVNLVLATTSASPAGTTYTVGKEIFKKEQADPLTKETLDRLVPSDIAKVLVDAYLSAAK
jgi:hypothetical protein